MSLSIQTLNGSQQCTVLRYEMGFKVPSGQPTQAGCQWGYPKFLKCSQLRQALLAGGRLQATIIMFSTQQ